VPSPYVTVRGLKDLGAALTKLDMAVKTQIVAEGIQAGAEEIRGLAAQLAPRRRGFLADHIVSVYSIASGLAQARIGPIRDAFYGGILNQGAKPHDIRPKRASKSRGARKRVLASSSKVYGRIVHHPGVPARPFLTVATVQGAPSAVAAAGRAMWLGIDRVAASVPKGTL
jgi:hypothetical protein